MDSLAKLDTSGFVWLIYSVLNLLLLFLALVEAVLTFKSLCNESVRRTITQRLFGEEKDCVVHIW